MPDISTYLALEVNTAKRNGIGNPSGREGLFGWNATGVGVVVDSTSDASDDGFAFYMPNIVGAILYSNPFAAPSPGRWLKVDYSIEVSAAVSLRFRVFFRDVYGKTIGLPFTGTAALAANTPVTHAVNLTAPTGAVSCFVVFDFPTASAATATLSKVYVSTTDSSSGLPRPVAPHLWLDVLSKSSSINTEQGNTLDGVDDVLTAGSLTAVIRDPDLDPSAATTLTKGREVRLTCTVGSETTTVWSGTLETADVEYDDTKGPTTRPLRIVITATDNARKLADAIVQFAPAGGFYGQVAHAAQGANIASFDGSQSPQPGTGQVARDDSAKAVDWIRRACNTHGGYVWVDNQNMLQQRLITYLGASPVATLSDSHDDAGALYYTRIGLNYGTRSLFNALTVRRLNFDETADDGAKDYGPYVVTDSETQYGRSTTDIEITSGSPSAIAAAVLPIWALPRVFPTEIRLNTAADIEGVLALTPYAPIQVKRTTPAFDEVVRVLRIRHEIKATNQGTTWLTTITPRPLETGTTVSVTNPPAGADTGPSDVTP